MNNVNSYEQLLYRYTKRIQELELEQRELEYAHNRYISINRELDGLEGSMKAIEHLAFDKVPDGIRDYIPNNVIKFPQPILSNGFTKDY